MVLKNKKASAREKQRRGIIFGYRSGLEEAVGADLSEKGIPVQYEQFAIPYTPPQKTRRYTPDFWLPNGVIIETKGRFMTADRQKHKVIKDEWPEADIRFVFSNAGTKINKGSKTTYADWCNRYGFRFAQKEIPEDWLAEPTNETSLNFIKRWLQEK